LGPWLLKGLFKVVTKSNAQKYFLPFETQVQGTLLLQHYVMITWSWDSVVGIVTGYGLDD
jgi:hypothetical protein